MKMKIKCASSYLSDSRKIQSYLVKREECLVPREYKSPPLLQVPFAQEIILNFNFSSFDSLHF